MHFVIQCTDRPGSADLRAANRPDHLVYLRGAGTSILVAGPLLAADGAVTGSLIILDAADEAAARGFAAADPYAKAGLFAEVSVTPWRAAIVNPPA